MGTNDVFMSGRVMMATNYIYIYLWKGSLGYADTDGDF